MRLVSTLLLHLFILGLSRSAVAQAPFWQWGLQSINPTTRDRSGATGCAVATGAGGQVYVGGTYGQGGLATRLFGGAGSVGPGAGGFVAQATATGQWAWVRDVVPGNPAPGSSPTAAVTGVAAGTAGEVYATGFAYGTTLRIGSRQQPLGPNRNLFVARLSRTGACDWLLVADNPHQVVNNFLAGPAIATDPLTGGVVVSGEYQANLQLGSTLLPAPPMGAGLFVARADSSGGWRSAVGATGIGVVTSGEQVVSWAAGRVVVGPRGQVAVVGSHSPGTLTFGATTLSVPSGFNSPNGGLFVAQLSPANQWEWAVGASAPTPGSNAEVVGAAYAPNGSLWVSGFGSNATAVGPLVLSAPGASSGWHFAGFAGQLSPTGQWGTVRQLSPSPDGWVQLASLALDGAGNAVLFGALRGFTGSAQTVVSGQVLSVAAGHVLTFASALSPAGQWLYAAPLAQPTAANGLRSACAVLDPSGGFYLAGGLVADMVVGNTRLNATDPRSANNFAAGDVVLARLANAGAPPRAAIMGDSLLCNGGAVTLTAAPSAAAVGHAWNTGATTPSIVVMQPGAYSVVTTFAGGVTATARFVVRALVPVLALTGDTLLCPGSSAVLRAVASPVPATYRWNTGATTPSLAVTQPGTYELTATYGPGCSVRSSRRVGAATLRIDGPALLCQGSALLSAVAPGAMAFRWSTGASTPTLSVVQAGTFTVVATYANGCTLTASHAVGAPVALISGDTVLCVGRAVVLTAGLPGAVAYRWNTGATTAAVTTTQPGTYVVTVSYGANCTATARRTVRALLPLPAFGLGADTTLCDQDSLVLRAPALEPGTGPVAYRWSNGATGPVLRVRQPGMYTLQVTSACDTHTASRVVAVRSCLLIPNVITPNRDGRNDAFAMRGLPPGPWALVVYNRWGHVVYQSDDYRNAWGEDAAPGLYYYWLYQPGKGAASKGWVEVIR